VLCFPDALPWSTVVLNGVCCSLVTLFPLFPLHPRSQRLTRQARSKSDVKGVGLNSLNALDDVVHDTLEFVRPVPFVLLVLSFDWSCSSSPFVVHMVGWRGGVVACCGPAAWHSDAF